MDIYVMSQLWCSGLTSRTAEQNCEFKFYLKNHYCISIGLFLSWACGRTQSSVVDVKGVQRKPTWSRAYPPIHTLCPLDPFRCVPCARPLHITQAVSAQKAPSSHLFNPDFPLDSSILSKQFSFFLGGSYRIKPAARSQSGRSRHRFLVQNCLCVSVTEMAYFQFYASMGTQIIICRCILVP